VSAPYDHPPQPRPEAAVRPAPGIDDPKPVPPGPAIRQFTLRAVLTGLVLGGLFAVCNVYVGLKTGATPNMSITAALLGFGFWGATRGVSGRRVQPWGLLENNISQTIGSSGALVASAGLAAPIPALAMLTGPTLPWPSLALWLLSVMLVGIAMAVPLRRRLIFVDKLPFPQGVATAELLREIHSRGSAAIERVVALVLAAVVGGVLRLAQGAKLIAAWGIPWSIRGISSQSLGFALDPSPALLGIGGLIGFRTGCSLLIGAIVAYGVMAPALAERKCILATVSVNVGPRSPGITYTPDMPARVLRRGGQYVMEWSGVMTEVQRQALLARDADVPYQQAVQKLYQSSQAARPSWGDMRDWLIWPGVALMVVASVVSLGSSWRSVLAVLPGHRGPPDQQTAQGNHHELPRAWFVGGLVVAGLLSVVLQVALFGILWAAAVAAVLLTFVLAMVAARVAGETGCTPVGPMGKVAQLVFGVALPNSPVPNLMAANVTGGAASQCADLLDDLKCGHLLGASPRWLTLAQVLGAVSGAMVGSAAYILLIPDPAQMLAGGDWPAPSATVWKAVAQVFMVGLGALPPGTTLAMAIAGLVGVAFPILPRLIPRALRPLVPGAVSLGIGFVLPPSMSMGIFLGGLLAAMLRRWFGNWATRFVVAGCAGLITGESLAGLSEAIWKLAATR
jgi:uncharacterized oligopeptide transporter (OPT) family protein